ncbi:hypothetical protein [Paracoccus sp. J56]|uniref:hypothetical protein n=1 Tax=Paracoccus sp. J56 TaxID=935850 RepID=UPI000A097033|nr:hypothetical protein [Paracoccus sp. J56]SMG45364.1 phage tail tape measure protein, lambda family [Paracoccus sp. J56]
MALDETGLLVKLEANVAKWEKDFNRAIVQQQRAAKRMEQIARQNAKKITSEYEGIGGRIGKAFNGIPASLKGIGGAFLGGLAGGVAIGGIDQIGHGIAGVTKEVANLKNEAEKSGVSTTVFQEWKFVADQNRISIDALTDGIKELHIRAGEFFLDDTGAGAEAFKKLGYSAEELKEKLKAPTTAIIEILGKLKNFDQAGRSFLLEEIFGGAGEQFGTLANQSEAALTATIAQAHEVGAVLDSEMINRAVEIDRKFTELTTRVESFGKRAIVAIADAGVELADFRAKLDEIFTDEAEGRSILGDELYDELAKNRDLLDQNAADVRHLQSEYDYLAQAAMATSNRLADVERELDAAGYGEQATLIRQYSGALAGLAQDYASGAIEAEDFSAKLADVQQEAGRAFAALNDLDGVSFGGVRNEVSSLGGVIASVTQMANDLATALAKAAGVDPGTKQLEALRQQHSAQQASMDSLNAMREANERFTASEQARNSATREQLALEREKEAVRKRAAEAGATLTDQEATAAAQAALAAEQARAAADRAGRSGGGGAGAGNVQIDEFAREAEAIKKRTHALQTEATVLATVSASTERLGDVSGYAATKARLLVAAQEAGKQITPRLEAEIDGLARAYANAGEEARAAGQEMQDANGKIDKGASALTDLFMAGLEGSESFASALRNLAKELLRSQIMKLISGFAMSGAPGSGLVGALGGALGGGFAEGGWTGPGSKYQPAGIVHANEYVFSREAVRRIGAANLDAMHRAAKSGARGYASGGLVGATQKLNKAAGESLRGSTAAQSINLAPTIQVNATGGTPEQNADLAWQISQETEKAMRNLIRDELTRNKRSGGMLR